MDRRYVHTREGYCLGAFTAREAWLIVNDEYYRECLLDDVFFDGG